MPHLSTCKPPHSPHTACSGLDLDAVHENEGGVWSPLGLAARLGQVDVMRLLLAHGADPEHICGGCTAGAMERSDYCDFGAEYAPLHLAAMGRHARALQCLLEAGARPTALDRFESSPLYVAARQLSPECVQVRCVCARALVGQPGSGNART